MLLKNIAIRPVPEEVLQAFSETYTSEDDPRIINSEYWDTQKISNLMWQKLDMCLYSTRDGRPKGFVGQQINKVFEDLGFQYWHPIWQRWQPNVRFPMILFKEPRHKIKTDKRGTIIRTGLWYNVEIIVPFLLKFQENTGYFGSTSKYPEVISPFVQKYK